MNKKLIFCLSGILFCQCLLLSTHKSNDRINLKALEQHITNLMEKNQIPGLAVGIVKGNEIILQKGFGYKNVKNKEPFDSTTLFGIGSNTKTFTSALIGILVDKGKIKWNDKIITHFPEFKVDDDYYTHHLTIEDLLSHRSGISGWETDKFWMDFTKNREEIIKALSHVKPKYDIRSLYDYNNVTYIVLGKLIEKVTNKTWEENLMEEILIPLGLSSSFAKKYKFSPEDNVITPYHPTKSGNQPHQFYDLSAIAPAGSIVSNIKDLNRWLMVHLNQGRLAEKILWTEKIQKDMLTPKILNMNSKHRPSSDLCNFFSYGLGWFIHDYRGTLVAFHGGFIPGQYSYIGLLPKEKIGVVIFSNLTGSPVVKPLMYYIFDQFIQHHQ